MSRNNIKLPQFLKEVDACTEIMTHNNLERFIHEIARTWPESRRKELLSLLKFYDSNSEKNIDTEVPTDDGYAEIIAEINEVRKKLEAINSGERELDSEYNEEWDDWYNSDAEEILFSDPQKLMDDIEAAVRLIHSCIDMEIYNEGCDLAETLSFLEVSASGDYNDYDGSPLGVQELYEHDLIEGNFEVLVKECLYLVYMGNKLSDRADEMFCMIENFGCYQIRLEDVLQTGNRELPEFNEFLALWIECLGKQRGRRTEELLKEAQSMVQDDFTLLENARKYVKEHPSLYKQLLEMKLNSGENQKMLQIGMEALGSIQDSYLIRGEIALLTATYAEKMCAFEKAEKCWLEAFRSNSSIINYMRLRFMTRHWQQYKAEVNSISEALFIKTKNEKNQYGYKMEQERENTISKDEYCTILFFEQQFDRMKEIGMDTKEPLGWSVSYMKQGISFMLLLLFRGDAFSSGL